MEQEYYKTAQELKNEGKVHDKVQEAKNYFANITKSGYNTYQKYSYLETYDIFPIVRQVCKEFKLRTKFLFTDTIATLIITDQEDHSSTYYTLPIPCLKIEDPNKYMQSVGKIQTYSMRFLYMQAFEIAVPDQIDNKKDKVAKSTYKNGKTINASSETGVTPGQSTINTIIPRNNTQDKKKITTQQSTNTRNIQDLERNISKELLEKGLEPTTTNLREHINNLFTSKQISPDEFRELKKKYIPPI